MSATADRRANPPTSGGELNLAAARPLETPLPAADWDHPHGSDLTDVLTRTIRAFSGQVGTTYPRLDSLIGATPAGRRDATAEPNPYRPRHMDRAARDYTQDSTLLGLAEMYRFYDRAARPAGSAAVPPQAAPAAEPPPQKPDFGFHTACALLADYPELLRRFGLALDLVVTPPAGLADRWQARVAFTAAQEHLNADETLRPWTALRHIPGRRFEPYAADDGFHGHRMLKLGADAVRTTDLDLDGAAMKFVEFSRVIDQYLSGTGEPGTAVAADPTAVPALHGAGLTVVHDDRDRTLADQMEADARHTAGVGPDGQPVAAAVLDAAHLVRGLRVDVGVADERTGRVTTWYPLCARTGEYAIRRPGAPAVPIAAAPRRRACQGVRRHPRPRRRPPALRAPGPVRLARLEPGRPAARPDPRRRQPAAGARPRNLRPLPARRHVPAHPRHAARPALRPYVPAARPTGRPRGQQPRRRGARRGGHRHRARHLRPLGARTAARDRAEVAVPGGRVGTAPGHPQHRRRGRTAADAQGMGRPPQPAGPRPRQELTRRRPRPPLPRLRRTAHQPAQERTPDGRAARHVRRGLRPRRLGGRAPPVLRGGVPRGGQLPRHGGQPPRGPPRHP